MSPRFFKEKPFKNCVRQLRTVGGPRGNKNGPKKGEERDRDPKAAAARRWQLEKYSTVLAGRLVTIPSSHIEVVMGLEPASELKPTRVTLAQPQSHSRDGNVYNSPVRAFHRVGGQ